MKTMLLAAAAALSLGVGSAMAPTNAHQMTGSTAATHAFQTAENEQQDGVRLTAENEQQDSVRLQVAVYTPSRRGYVWNDEPIG